MRKKTEAVQLDFEKMERGSRTELRPLLFAVRVEVGYRPHVVAPDAESAKRAARAYLAANLGALVNEERASVCVCNGDLERIADYIRQGEPYEPLVISADAPAHEDWPPYLKEWHADAMTPIERDEARCQRVGEPLPLVSQPVQWREPSYTDRERAILAACDGLGDPVGVLNLAREMATNTAILGDMIAAPGWKEDDAEYEGRIARQTDLACAMMVAVEGGKTPDVTSNVTPEKLAA
jgi:hypothetical protein